MNALRTAPVPSSADPPTTDPPTTDRPSRPRPLKFIERDGRLSVAPADEERFEVRLARLVEHLRTVDRQRALASPAEYRAQFRLLVARTGRWLRETAAAAGIGRAFLTVREGVLTLFLVQAGPAYDAELMDAVTDFETVIYDDPELDRITLNSLVLPRLPGATLGSWAVESVSLEFPVGTD